MSTVTLILFILGIVLLVAGAELLVRGSSRLALAWGISPLVIGLTVVAYGTSAPELAVSVKAAYAGQADLALGNVVGSNIFNVLFILGVCALITPLRVSMKLVRVDVPIAIVASVALLFLGWDGSIGQFDGLLLFCGVVAYTYFSIRQSRKETKAIQEEYAEMLDVHESSAKPNILIQFLLVLGGVGLLVLGAQWLVDGAVALARVLGVSELVIGLTIVAAGTSLPEVATSVVASIRGERDIAVGNVVGSNIFNLLSVLGMSALVAPSGVDVSQAALRFDIPIMIAVMVACMPLFFTGHLIARWEGFLFLTYYVAYAAYLILSAQKHWALPMYSDMVAYVAFPLTGLAIATSLFYSWKHPDPVEAAPR